ncbi:MAG: peptidase S8, partial [bacterium]
RVAGPGWVSGSASLHGGLQVPILWPELRGLRSWATAERVTGEVANFLERVAYETRNLGQAPQERAINFAATEAFQVERIFQSALEANLRLDSITVEPSPLCRPESDCWDVKLTFFDPLLRLEQARVVYRFTVDVSEIVPVTLGKVRHWELF